VQPICYSDIFIIKPTRCTNFTVRLSIIRSLFTVHSALVFVIQVWRVSETCRVSWQNKFVKLMLLAGFITKKFVKTHGHTNVRFVNYPFLYFLPFSRHYLCVQLLMCFLHSIHVYNCALYTFEQDQKGPALKLSTNLCDIQGVPGGMWNTSGECSLC